jgi:transcriptional regulator with XRE-family HTH domain
VDVNTVLMKRQRLALGLSQREVAEAVGRTRATVASWETNRKTPEARVLPDLARLLQVSIEDLLTDPTPEPTGEAVSS